MHAVAHIEFNAVNLALDAVWRFDGLPAAYYLDWLSVASEEAHHFSLLREHLQGIGFDGYAVGGLAGCATSNQCASKSAANHQNGHDAAFAPPTKAVSISKARSIAFKTFRASATISGPMPSPGRTAIFMVTSLTPCAPTARSAACAR